MAGLARPILSVPVHSGYIFEARGVEKWKGEHPSSSDGLLKLYMTRFPVKVPHSLQKKARLFGLGAFSQ